jgi:repressor LexA
VPSAAQHLKALESKGALSREPRRSRSIVLKQEREPAAEEIGFRLLGDIAAGAPLAIDEAVRPELLTPSPSWFGRGEHVAVRVRGDSMTGDAISDGDFAIVRLGKSARPHEIAAVRTYDGEVTLKRVELAGGEAHLIASNPAHPTRTFPADQVEIVGTLAGIIRRH